MKKMKLLSFVVVSLLTGFSLKSAQKVTLPANSDLWEAVRNHNIRETMPLIANPSGRKKIIPPVDIDLWAAVVRNDIGNTMLALIANPARINMGQDGTLLRVARSAEMVKLLIFSGADVHARNLDRFETPLFSAENVQVAEALLDAGAEVNAQNALGNTPLHRTCDPAIARLLVERGADLNLKNSSRNTPLHVMLVRNDSGCTEIARDLLLRRLEQTQ